MIEEDLQPVKDYLEQVFGLEQLIKANLEILSDLRCSLTRSTTRISDMPKSYNSASHDLLGDTIANIVDLEAEIDTKTDELINLKRDIYRRVNQVQEPTYKAILEFKYLKFHTLAQLAQEFSYCNRHIYRLHDEALRAFAKYMPEQEECIEIVKAVV